MYSTQFILLGNRSNQKTIDLIISTKVTHGIYAPMFSNVFGDALEQITINHHSNLWQPVWE